MLAVWIPSHTSSAELGGARRPQHQEQTLEEWALRANTYPLLPVETLLMNVGFYNFRQT